MLIHWQGFFLKSGKMDLLDLFLDVSAISCFRGYYRSRRAASFTRLRPLSIFSDEAIFLASVRLRNYTEAHILQQSSFKKHRATRCSSFNGNRILNKHIDGGKCVNLIFFLTFTWPSMHGYPWIFDFIMVSLVIDILYLFNFCLFWFCILLRNKM